MDSVICKSYRPSYSHHSTIKCGGVGLSVDLSRVDLGQCDKRLVEEIHKFGDAKRVQSPEYKEKKDIQSAGSM